MTALALGLVAAICWGFHDILIRYLSRTVPLMAALFTVLTVGAIFQGIVLLGNGADVAIQGTALWLSLGAGVAFLIASVGLYFAFARGPVGLVSPLIASYPVLSLSLALWEGSSIAPLQILAIFVLIAGVCIVATSAGGAGGDYPPKLPTIVLSLFSALGFGFSFHLGQMAALYDDELATTLVARITALLLLGLFMFVAKSDWRIERRSLWFLAAMGICDGIALLSVMSAARFPNPEFAAIVASTFGVFTILMAWKILKERLSLIQVAGCGLTFAAIGYLSL